VATDATGERVPAVKIPQIDAAWLGPAECRNCGIRHLALFADLNEQDFRLIHMPLDELWYEPGATLYGADEKGAALFTVRQGMVKLLQLLPDGTQRIVRLLNRGAIVGLEALVRPTYEHTAIAVQSVAVCRIPTEVVQKLSRDTPRLHHRLMEQWHRSLRQADEFLTELSTGSAKRRLARLLLQLTAEDPGKPLRLFTREDLGAMLGVTLETASRTVSDFKRLGLIREQSHNVVLCDRERLSQVALQE